MTNRRTPQSGVTWRCSAETNNGVCHCLLASSARFGVCRCTASGEAVAHRLFAGPIGVEARC